MFDNGFKVKRQFGNDNIYRTDRNGDLKRHITCLVSHNLNNTATAMRLRGIANFIYHFSRGIKRGIKADCVFSGSDIVIDSSRNANARDTVF